MLESGPRINQEYMYIKKTGTEISIFSTRVILLGFLLIFSLQKLFSIPLEHQPLSSFSLNHSGY